MLKILLSSAWSKIKSFNWKKYWIYIVAIVLVILLLLNYIKLRSTERDKVRYYGNFIQTDREYKDAKGNWVRETSALVVTNKELQTMIANGDVELQKKMDIIKAMGIKIKNLESIGSSGFAVHDTILIPYYLAMPDTAKGHFYFTDGYFSMDLTSCAETGTQMVYDYKDTLTWTANAYFKDKWRFKNIFCPRDKYIKLNSQLANPKAHITSQEYYKIKGKIRRLAE